MPSTWAGTASNQLVTFYALKDAVDTGVLRWKGTAITGSNEIVTKDDVDTYVYMNSGNSTWSGYSSTRCPTKQNILQAGIFTFYLYANKATSGNAGYDLAINHKRNGTSIQIYTATVNSTTCSVIFGLYSSVANTYLLYNDTIELTTYYSGTGSAINMKVSNSISDCGTNNYTTCGQTFTITSCINRSLQPQNYDPCV